MKKARIQGPTLFLPRSIRLVSIALLLGLILAAAACGPKPSYRSFMSQNQAYYADIVSASEDFLATNAALPMPRRRIRGDDMALPQVIRDLHPAYVYADTNTLGIRIGTGRGSYWVCLYPSPSDASLWELGTSAEGMRRALYSDKRKGAVLEFLLCSG